MSIVMQCFFICDDAICSTLWAKWLRACCWEHTAFLFLWGAATIFPFIVFECVGSGLSSSSPPDSPESKLQLLTDVVYV